MPAPHQTPYPSAADRPISFSEMTYHLGLVREDVKEVAESVKEVLHVVAKDREERQNLARWRVGIAVTALLSLGSLLASIVTNH